MTQANLIDALQAAQSALNLIASPVRADGTYNRDRRACELLAKEALEKIEAILLPPATEKVGALPPPAKLGTGPFVIGTDGGSRGNPGDSGWGAVVVQGDVVVFAGGGFIGKNTNQVAELAAAIEGLSRTPEGAVVQLISDSKYVVKGISEWRKGWERNNWIASTGKPVANIEYWKRLFALVDKRKVAPQWVRGHNGHPLNERADQLANKAMDTRLPLIEE